MGRRVRAVACSLHWTEIGCGRRGAVLTAPGKSRGFPVWVERRSQMPTISLKTVYQTLHSLAALGQLQQIDLGTGSARFDLDTRDSSAGIWGRSIPASRVRPDGRAGSASGGTSIGEPKAPLA